MTSAEAESYPMEEPVTSSVVEEDGEPRDLQVAVSAVDDAAEEKALSGKECGPATTYDDLSNPHVFKMCVREVDENYMSVVRGLGAFSREDEEVCRNAVDICKDIIAMEQSLFSEAPSYITNYIATQRTETDAWNKAVQSRWTIPTPEGPPRTWEEQRAYVDPGVPLMLPYNAERFRKEHPERVRPEGTYYDLFYGDGTQVIFSPPPDNKRKQIEEERKKHPQLPYHGPYVFKPQQKRTMRVSPDFVPSCAEVDKPRTPQRKKPVNTTKAKKNPKKKVTTK
ncbi:hypothetical protein, conserved [Leishmania tarentolae]|uniref:Uncharacterized protein n=1 Tax=Leishmania tarentolae TaxID=5689 RepID=A0A640KHY1_LEITA|nr:hypothetical protein, conserved [Leishmania tarentolae]